MTTKHEFDSMTRVYVQCDNDVVESVSLDGSNHTVRCRDDASGFRSVVFTASRTRPTGADGRLPYIFFMGDCRSGSSDESR